MRAMLLSHPCPIEERPLAKVEIDDPAPGLFEVRISVIACGVCHTDLHTVEGDMELPRLPLIPGHQIIGIIEKRGDAAHRFRPGERVGVPWLYRTCGTCEYCTGGLENLCKYASFTGFHVNGGYADYVVAHEDFVYPIPEEYTDIDAAPLLCGGIIGYRALMQCGLLTGQRLGLYGFGGSAHITIQIANHLGFQVYVFTRSDRHRRHAQSLGAVWAGGAEDEPPARMHAGIIFAPAGPIVREGLRVLERGGTLVLAGVTMTTIPELDYDSHLYWEKCVRSVANFTRRDAKEFLELAGKIPVKTTTTSYPLDKANEALADLKQSNINGTAVLVTW
ncbi:MAG: zinc-dependent alcohol dehydrogenase family protein [Spirochaetales bacterium]|nr:zinc-dependent alcohol dehydrogenase family protein [Spirochaetales bacterium]